MDVYVIVWCIFGTVFISSIILVILAHSVFDHVNSMKPIGWMGVVVCIFTLILFPVTNLKSRVTSYQLVNVIKVEGLTVGIFNEDNATMRSVNSYRNDLYKTPDSLICAFRKVPINFFGFEREIEIKRYLSYCENSK